MTIKDVEKRTGLTVKSIRYYEKKGLVSIKRNTDNDYREFTEEDICRFKLIKILRYLNFIEKVSDDTYASACDLDKQFCDRFIRIINNR